MYLQVKIFKLIPLTLTLLIAFTLISKCATNDDGDDDPGSSEPGDYDDQDESPIVTTMTNTSSSLPVDSSSKFKSIISTESAAEPSTISFEKEGQSLSKLQKFMLEGVENMIKQTLPTLVRSGLETNVSTACANSLLALVSGLRDSQIWAFRSKYS